MAMAWPLRSISAPTVASSGTPGGQLEAEMLGRAAAALDPVERVEQVAVEPGVMHRDPVARHPERGHIVRQRL